MNKIKTPPTACLPHIQSISSCPPQILFDALNYLRAIYVPEVRGSRRRGRQHHAVAPQRASQQSAERDVENFTEVVENIRSDAFERAYAIRWLTALVESCLPSCKTSNSDASMCPLLASQSYAQDSEGDAQDSLLHESAALLAICAGTAAAGTFTRNFTFPSPSLSPANNQTITVQLTDVPLDNGDFSSVGAQTWGAACVLAEMIVDEPWEFGLCTKEGEMRQSEKDDIPLKVLELGAGTGLVSLVIGKVLQEREGRREAHVLATDFHPSV